MLFEVLSDECCEVDNSTVSVIIPYFNMGLFIDEAISSVLSQSYQNIEVVVVDDGSTDAASVERINSLKLSRVKIVRQKNSGPASARNTAIKIARGQYILPLDADDVLAPEYIEKCLPKLVSNDSIGVVYSNTVLFGEKQGRMELREPTLQNMLIWNAVVVTGIFRKSHWEEFGGYKEAMSLGLEDYEFWMNFHEKGLQFERVKEDLFFYRQRSSSIANSVSSFPENHYKMMKNIFNYHKELYVKNVDVMFEALIEMQKQELARSLRKEQRGNIKSNKRLSWFKKK